MRYGNGGNNRGRKQYDNNLTCTLWENDERRNGKQDPHFRGSAEVDGVEYWANAWVNKQDDGRRRINIKLEPKVDDRSPQQRNREQGQPRGNNGGGNAPRGGGRGNNGFDDIPDDDISDIPF